MGDWKTRFPAWKRPALSGALSGAAKAINGVIAILIFVGLGLAADAYFHTTVDHALERNQATFSQEVNEQLATAFIGESIGLIIAALLCGFVFVVFEAPMRLYWAVLGCGSAYIGWLYFGGRALGQ